MARVVVPPGYEMDEWQGYVRKGRQFVKQIGDGKFGLGDTVKEMLAHRHGDSVQMILDVYARQIRANPHTLKAYRYVATAWPEDMRRHDVPWSVHRVLAPHPRRFEIIRTQPRDPVTGEPDEWTYDHAQREMQRLPQNPVTHEEKLERVRHMLRDRNEAASAIGRLLERPDVAKQVVRDPQVRRSLRAAETEHGRELREEAEVARELAEPEPVVEAEEPQEASVDYRQTPSAVLHVIGLGTTFSRALRAAVPDLQQIDVAEEGQEAVREVLGKVREACDWCEDAVMSGRSGMDDALARMLGAEGNGEE